MLLQPATEILQEAGIVPIDSRREKKEVKQISSILDTKGLSREEIADQLKELARFSDKEEIRLRANELALKLHGELRNDTGNQIPSFTFVIQNYNGEIQNNDQFTDILTPRT